MSNELFPQPVDQPVDHPLDTLWRQVGAPPLVHKRARAGVCAMTGQPSTVLDLKDGLPTTFAAHHLIPHRTGDAGVSARMVHAMTAWGPVRAENSAWKDSGRMAVVVDRGEVVDVTRWEGDPHTVTWLTLNIADVLASGAAVVAPTTRKKHSTLWATWGQIATESGATPVTPRMAAAFRLVLDAKSAGVTENEIREQEPTFRAVGLLGGITQAAALWRGLSPLRARPQLLDLAILWGRQPKPKEGQ